MGRLPRFVWPQKQNIFSLRHEAHSSNRIRPLFIPCYAKYDHDRILHLDLSKIQSILREHTITVIHLFHVCFIRFIRPRFAEQYTLTLIQ